MSSKRYQGKIIRWKEEKGFGFIKTSDIEKDIFLHISDIKNRQKQPQIGQTIYFDLQFEAQGKLKAINASFDAQVSPQAQRKKSTSQNNSNRNNSLSSNKIVKVLAVGAIIAVGVTVLSQRAIRLKCNIKGNISYPSGEKLYHKPGYRDYAEVDIFENEGEKWFCTEQEAINAGFRDAAK
jgi:cold shock CspA family protein